MTEECLLYISIGGHYIPSSPGLLTARNAWIKFPEFLQWVCPHQLVIDAGRLNHDVVCLDTLAERVVHCLCIFQDDGGTQPWSQGNGALRGCKASRMHVLADLFVTIRLM